jgi:hypothetical protein
MRIQIQGSQIIRNGGARTRIWRMLTVLIRSRDESEAMQDKE